MIKSIFTEQDIERAKQFGKDERAEKELLKKGLIPERYRQILENKNFFEILNAELDKFIVGEIETRQTLFLIALGGKLVTNAEPTSSNIMVNDLSGAGKDYTVNSVLKLLPKTDVVKRKRISETAFSYWHNSKFEPNWSWDGIIFYNEDISNSILNSDVFKVLSSNSHGEENISTITIKNMAMDIGIKGKPVIILTIANANPKQELLRRYPTLTLDTTEAQTKLILKRKAEFHSKGKKPEYDETIKEAIQLLKPVKVKIVFAEKLANILSTKNIIVRTHFDRLIDYIKFSTALYQFQRERDEEGFLLATDQDYELGRIALIKTTSNIFSIPLTKNQQRILDILKDLPREEYSISDLEPRVTFISDRMLRTEIRRLTEYGFLSINKEVKRDDSKKPVMMYKYLDHYKIHIPSWQEIIQNTSNVSNDEINSINTNVSNNGTIETIETIAKKTAQQKQPILHKCVLCGQTPCSEFNQKGQPVCVTCLQVPEDEEVI